MSLHVLTFAGFVKGLSAAALESQYFDEYTKLAKFVDSVTIVTAEASEINEIPDNVKIEKLPIPKTRKIRGLLKLFHYVRFPHKNKRDFDLIYVRTMSPPEILSFWLAKVFLNKPGVLMIGGTCFYEPLTLKNRIYRWFYSNALKSADKVIVYSKLMIPFVHKVNPNIDDDKFEIVHNAIDPDRFYRIHDSDKLGSIKKENEKIILFVGKINVRKGVSDILEILTKSKQNVKAVLIGSYEVKSKEFLEIQQYVKENNLEKRAIFLGKIPNNELNAYYSCADIFVYMTKACEGIPRAILEAMACGLPVVASSVAGIPDAVIDGKTGFLAQNTDDSVKCIENILENESLHKEMSQNARQLMENEFSYKVTIPKIVSIFNSITQS